MDDKPSVLDHGLSPLERGCEIVFGILMSVSVASATQIGTSGQAGVRELLFAALGCNLAWGMIDAAMYLLQCQFGRFRNQRTLRELQAIADEDAFRERVRAELPPVIGDTLTADTYAGIRRVARAWAPTRARFWPANEFGAAAVIWALVFASTFPVVVPFLVVSDPWIALRSSNVVAVVMLFVLGWWIGRWSGASPGWSGAFLALVGTVLAVLCILMGG
jgi:VIT1/CCC1 family predicted Fe2+/Mn2+ transporter